MSSNLEPLGWQASGAGDELQELASLVLGKGFHAPPEPDDHVAGLLQKKKGVCVRRMDRCVKV